MGKKTKYIIIDHFASDTEEERKQIILNIFIDYINTRIDTEITNEILQDQDQY